MVDEALLHDVVDRHHVRLSGIDTGLGEDGHQRLIERVKVAFPYHTMNRVTLDRSRSDIGLAGP